MLNMSSILPETIIDSTADANPATKRPVIAPAIDGVIPEIRQAMLYINDAKM
jgi:hypothetical protein